MQFDSDSASRSVYVGPPRTAAELAAARQLHTRTYAKIGAVHSKTGLVDDGYMVQRRWVVAQDGPVTMGTVSFIYPHTSLPTLEAFGIDPLRTPKLAAPWSEGRVVEISTFTVDRAYAARSYVSGLLYRAIWQERHLRSDHDVWVMSSRPQLFDRLCQLFPGPFELLGRAENYYNHGSVAYMLDFRIFRSALEQRSPSTLLWLDGRIPRPASPRHEEVERIVPSGRDAAD